MRDATARRRSVECQSTIGNYANVTTSAGRAGGMLIGAAFPFASSDRTDDPALWSGSLAVDGRLGVGAGVTSGSGDLYLTVARHDCSGVPDASGFQIVLAIPLSWGS